eukprot:5935834-Amphidinium_carterae.1
MAGDCQAWAGGLTVSGLSMQPRGRKVDTFRYKLLVDAPTHGAAVLAKHVPTLAAAASAFAGQWQQCIVQLWGGCAPRPLRLSEVHKPLTKDRTMPSRDGQHVCCFCGHRHIYTGVPITAMNGCYRAVWRELSDYRWSKSGSREKCRREAMKDDERLVQVEWACGSPKQEHQHLHNVTKPFKMPKTPQIDWFGGFCKR